MNNEFLLDKDLDPTAKCILAVILTNKDDWVVYPEEIARRVGVSRSTVEKCFKTFKKLGYAEFKKTSLGYKKSVSVERKFSDRRIFNQS